MNDEQGDGLTAACVIPEVIKGFRDLSPPDALLRQTLIEKVRQVVGAFGFLPIETPAFEYVAALVGPGGEDVSKQLFRMKSPEDEDIALRFDLTVPFARYLSEHLEELKLPFRRYHVASVWRVDKPGPGRFREFTQFDFDAAGSANMAVDAEIVRVTCDVMAALGVTDYTVFVNHRKIVDALLASCGIEGEERHKHVLRVIDKLAKVGMDEVRKELGPGRVDESGDPIRGVGLDDESIQVIERFLGVNGATREAVLEGILRLLPDGDIAQEAVTQVRQFLVALEHLGVAEDRVQFSPSLARGLDYYTGPVFETVLSSAPEFGSVMGGGRYDGLVRRFLGIEIPATGASIGVDRLLAAMKTAGSLASARTTTSVLMTVMAQNLLPECLSMATELRESGINTEVFYGGPKEGFRAQLAWANRQGIPLAIIMGEDEAKAGSVSIKDLRVGAENRKGISDRAEYVAKGRTGQVTVPRPECVRAVRDMLAR